MLNSSGLPNGRSNGLGRMAWDLQIGRPMYNSNIRPGLGSLCFQKLKIFFRWRQEPSRRNKRRMKIFFMIFSTIDLFPSQSLKSYLDRKLYPRWRSMTHRQLPFYNYNVTNLKILYCQIPIHTCCSSYDCLIRKNIHFRSFQFEMATEINSNTSPIINEKIEENLEDDFQR